MPLGGAGYIEADPTNADITYGGVRWQLSSFNKKTGQGKISPYPESNIGAPSSAKKYRFQWTYPLFFRLTTQKRMYVTSQVVHVTEDQGHSFEIISPDLSRNDPKLQEKRDQ
jgi:hypothetical protein